MNRLEASEFQAYVFYLDLWLVCMVFSMISTASSTSIHSSCSASWLHKSLSPWVPTLSSKNNSIFCLYYSSCSVIRLVWWLRLRWSKVYRNITQQKMSWEPGTVCRHLSHVVDSTTWLTGRSSQISPGSPSLVSSPQVKDHSIGLSSSASAKSSNFKHPYQLIAPQGP